MCRHGGMHQALVVHVFVRFGALHQPVGDEQAAEGFGVDHFNRLELALPAMEHLLNLADSERSRDVQLWRRRDGKKGKVFGKNETLSVGQKAPAGDERA